MMHSNRTRRHMIDLLFTLALFCVFAASALLVVLIGANVYKNTAAQMDSGYTSRTSLTYVATKIRQNDRAGCLYLDEMGGEPAIVLEQPLDGYLYQTWIYHYDGGLRELFMEKGAAFEPRDGSVIVEVPDFDIRLEDQTFILQATDASGNTSVQKATPRCGVTERGEASV